MCDSILMKLCIDDLDYFYHDEMIEVGKKLINFFKYTGISEDEIEKIKI